MSFIWRKQGVVIEPSSEPRYRLVNEELVDGDRTKLIIEKAERKDSALFTCTAINDYGEDSMNIQLTVQDIPDAPQNLEVHDISSRNVRLTWNKPFDGNSPILHYTLMWRQINNEVAGGPITVPGSETTLTVRGQHHINLSQAKQMKSYYLTLISIGKANMTENRLKLRKVLSCPERNTNDYDTVPEVSHSELANSSRYSEIQINIFPKGENEVESVCKFWSAGRANIRTIRLLSQNLTAYRNNDQSPLRYALWVAVEDNDDSIEGYYVGYKLLWQSGYIYFQASGIH
ncbi:down syndrome cell adhesion molecule-like protein 1-like protein [Caerostris extrusa]|uniref:Down syndrome cell adhesion molecule-like protein 1-like protein n=1 Tax=Caerostris extrusa TaxID=172846 RepID=A0AAV4SBJ0_CAEEX|nr:down syndrome cell adhesion molecule-like protein 1-like protein [Caerostris extrusa]